MADLAQVQAACDLLGRMFVEQADQCMRMTGRAERAEAEADSLGEALGFAVSYIRARAEQGDAGAATCLQMIFPVDPESGTASVDEEATP